MAKKTLKQLRLEQGFTQSEMAEKIGYARKSSYQMLESGQVRLRFEQAEKIAEIFNISLDEIFFDTKVRAKGNQYKKVQK